MKSLLVLAALLVGTLAGCLTGPTQSTTSTTPIDASPSPKSFDAKAPEMVWVTASDGARLENAVYRPDTDEPVPVFINFSPYWGDTAMAEGDHFSQYMVHEYVPRGYAVVLSSVRGTGHSEGCFQIGGDRELEDAAEVVEFFGTQAWSNGNVGAGGKSYDSTTQNGMVAKFPNEHLKTLFHVSGITDMYRYNAKDGVVYQNGLDFTPRYYATQGTDEYGLPVGSGGGATGDEDAASLLRLLGDACPEAGRHVQSGTGTAVDGLKDAYWQERDWVHFLPQSGWTGSVFLVHGLQDWNVKPDDIDPWVDILQQKGNPVKGWLHQQTENGGHLYPMRDDWNQTMLRWLDHYLKGKPNGIDHELGFDVEGVDGVWRHDAMWPPAATPALLGASPGAGEVVPQSAGDRFAGVPYATGVATSLSADPILYARIVDRSAQGDVVVDEAVARPALSADLSRVAGYTPGTPVAFNLTFYPMDYEVQDGHALVLVMGFGPEAAAEAATPTNANFVHTPAQVVGTTYQDVRLFMPRVTGGVALAPQPGPMPCWAC